LSNKYRVRANRLSKLCNPNMFKFNSTEEIQPLDEIIGQERAVNSLLFALNIDKQGYNIYLSGAFGTGKNTLARAVVEKKAVEKPVPSDWCYVYNYKRPDCPKVIELPPGYGRQFKKDLATQIEKLVKHVSKAFESEDFEYGKNNLLNRFLEQTNAIYLKLDEEARAHGFAITRNQHGVINSIPIKDGEPLSQEQYLAMSEQERADLMKRSALVQEIISSTFRQYKDLERRVKEKIKKIEQETVRSVSAPYFAYLYHKYRSFQGIVEYLEEMHQDLLENVDLFIKQDDNPAVHFLRSFEKRTSLRRYLVNLIVDNSKLTHAPVIYEPNPTYANLFGQIEYEGEFGVLTTDFSKIKPGSIHKANGGYLILNLLDVLKNYYVWDALKRVLKNRSIKIESIGRVIGISNTETLEPEPIPANLKVIIIGEPWLFYLLYAQDEEFRKLFKVRADFNEDMPRNKKSCNNYARFISSVCRNEQLRHFTPDGVAKIIDYGSRMAENQKRLSTRFNQLMEIIYEANAWAESENAVLVSKQHVIKAIEEKRYRSSMLEDNIHDYIKNDIIMINTQDYRIGELNGLAVYQAGDYHFGKPVRITAKTFMGEKGLVNIEREIRLSGTIHSKGVLTLNGYLGAQYAQNRPLSLSASLTFEQSYQGIEGDSASSAELYALLSSLAEVEIYQGIAVTGSVNQNGEIQPVGGVNEKIEGFFKVCKENQLNGRQGVIIPYQNIDNLMLDEEVIEAVKNKKFNIWAVTHIDEGLEILTGMPAGKKEDNGKFTPGSIHDHIDRKLEQWMNRLRMPPDKPANSAPKLSHLPNRRRRRRS
jgi:lon-related putative ATP-dependent protease